MCEPSNLFFELFFSEGRSKKTVAIYKQRPQHDIKKYLTLIKKNISYIVVDRKGQHLVRIDFKNEGKLF